MAARGFTLIEIAVVLLLMVIVLGFVGVRLERDDNDMVHDEASRLVLALQGAQQQAILEGRLYAFELRRDGYGFLQFDADGKPAKIGSADPLGPHALSYHITLNPIKSATSDAKKRTDIVYFDPSGALDPFTFVLELHDSVWYVQGQNDGQIRASRSIEPAAA
ncbi:MAG: GspH/FimT family protein [Gammaproteobacteria bacterium]|nr:GspH/FimT family protein [Gammaproteobacteria bacterium]